MSGRFCRWLWPAIAPIALLSASPRAQEADTEAVRAVVRRVLEDQNIPGAVIGVLVKDRLVFREGFGHRDLEADEAMNPDVLFQIGSATKSMTAELMGILRDEGRLEFDDPIVEHLPEDVDLPEPLRSITLRQLATHTSGLPRNAVNRKNVPGTPSVAEAYSVQELYDGLERTELVAAPGESCLYSNLAYALLGHILERVSGQPYEELLRDRLLRPLGMSSTGVQPTAAQERRLAAHYWNRDDPRVARERWTFGEIAGHGGVFSCVDDLAKYLALQYATGDELPVRPQTLAELHKPVVLFEDSDEQWMGTGWFVYRFPGGTIISHDGEVDGNSASIAFVPELGLGVIALANLGGDSAGSLAQAALRAAVMGRR